MKIEAQDGNTNRDFKKKNMAEGSDKEDQRVIDIIRKRLEGGLLVGSSELEENRLPRCYDVQEFLTYLRETDEYKRAVRLREEEILSRRPGISFAPEEIKASFEATPTFWEMLLNFGQDVLHLSYREADYPKEFTEPMNVYLNIVRKGLIGGLQADPDLIRESDSERWSAHSKAARFFVSQGLTEDMRTARCLIRLLMIDRGIEYIHDARLSIQRNSVGLTINEDAAAISQATARAVRDRFLSAHPQAEFVDRGLYIDAPALRPNSLTRDPENNRVLNRKINRMDSNPY